MGALDIMTDPTPRRIRDKALSGEVRRVYEAYPFARGNPALERVARRLAVLSIGLRELRQQIKAEGGAGRAETKRLTELRQFASECAAHEGALNRAALMSAERPEGAFALIAEARRQILNQPAPLPALEHAPPSRPLTTARLLRERDELNDA
jgi:hypothetical protein